MDYEAWQSKELDGVPVEAFKFTQRGRMPPGVNVSVHESGAEFVQVESGAFSEVHPGDWVVWRISAGALIIPKSEASERIR